MSPRRRNIIVGLVVLLGLGIATWMVLLFAGRFASLFASPGLPINMTSDRADGLSDGSSITYRGVQAGRVTGVHLRPDGQGVLITAEVNKKNPLPANLHAVIRTQSAFGNSAAIELEVTGSPTGQLAAGANLKADYEGSALIPKQFTELAEDFHRQQLIQHLDQTIVSIRQQSDRAGQILEEVQNVVSNPKTREDLKATLANVRNATESAARVGSNLEKFTVKLDRISDQTEGTMSEVRVAVAKLGSSLDHFESISNKIDQGKGTAGLLVNDTKLYQGLVDTTKELNLTIADLQRVVQQWEQEGVTLKLGK
jgi:phospholipid/cholesterol/gamma-HCH transport system substrate-binding protein